MGVAFIAGFCFPAGAESVPCPPFDMEMNVTDTAGVQDLVEALNCTGGGTFNVTWYGTVNVEQPIKVTGGSHLTVAQASSHSSRFAEHDFDQAAVIDGGNSSGIFHVLDKSTLTLVKLELVGGNAGVGGAVAAISSSSLDIDSNIVTAVDCVFTGNAATYAGGEGLLMS